VILWCFSLLTLGGIRRSMERVISTNEGYIVAKQGDAASAVVHRLGIRHLSLEIFCRLWLLWREVHVGAYSDGRLSDVLSDIVYRRQKLFPVHILPERSDFQTISYLHTLPFLKPLKKKWVYRGFAANTYYVTWGTSVESVLMMAERALYAEIGKFWDKRGHVWWSLTQDQFVILASIVEKETHLFEEYSKIAKVYLRRLGPKLRGRLYADPTVRYVAERHSIRLRARIFKKNLSIEDADNTYRYSGLPSCPIGNTSVHVLREIAFLNNLGEDEYFFWHPAYKKHVFSKTHSQHLARRRKAPQYGV